jgi:hypothetical protein
MNAKYRIIRHFGGGYTVQKKTFFWWSTFNLYPHRKMDLKEAEMLVDKLINPQNYKSKIVKEYL